MSTDVEDRPFTKLELESLRPIKPDCENITSLSTDSLYRYYGHLIVKLSPRRGGMKLRNALGIADGTIPPKTAD